eukprot:TRINITY_DN13722_c1_g1_i1.p4 TRINITY_DN13722_c1_g1~~TRINITY_DN13722_c1_g1_i1.p4  ORF type:complete len:122 (-),score=8.93 TRINITY_DN13722_c1_g1_i1:526-891(-)
MSRCEEFHFALVSFVQDVVRESSSFRELIFLSFLVQQIVFSADYLVGLFSQESPTSASFSKVISSAFEVTPFIEHKQSSSEFELQPSRKCVYGAVVIYYVVIEIPASDYRVGFLKQSRECF